MKCGRKGKTTKHGDAKLLRDIKRNPRKTSEELKRNLDESGAQILSSLFYGNCCPKEEKPEDKNQRHEEKKVKLGKKY